MEHTKSAVILDRLVSPLGACLTPETARRILGLKADPELQAHLDAMSERYREDALTPEEQIEYREYVSFSTFIAILKSKARQLLAGPPDE
jgi:hypothetical protein